MVARSPSAPTSSTLALHKPPGVVVTAHDERGRATVYDVLRKAGAPTRRTSATPGRLDADSEGLLILTTDGALVNRLTHPRYHVPRRLRGRARPSARTRATSSGCVAAST